MHKIVLVICAIVCFFQTNAQSTETQSPMLFIYDASGSMWAKLEGKIKKKTAEKVLSSSINNLSEDQNIGLITYGHRRRNDCNDVELMVGLENTDKTEIIKKINAINPTGRTPLERAATLALNTLAESNTKATIILLTDGIESCGGNICDVIAKAKDDGINFKLHIVGFGIRQSRTEQLKCAAEAGGGNFYNAKNAVELTNAISEAFSETINYSDANLSVFATKNGTPVDAWVRAFAEGTQVETSATRTYRDTSNIVLPPGKYTIEVRPLENTKIQSTTFGIEMFAGESEHKTINFDGGKVNVTALNNNEGWDATVRVSSKDGAIAVTGRTYGKSIEIELNTGIYDIELFGLQMNGLDVKVIKRDVIVVSGQSVDISHNYQTGIAMIGIKGRGKLLETTISVIEKTTETEVVNGISFDTSNGNPKKFVLNPGDYKIRLQGRKNGRDTTKWFDITVKQGETVSKIFEW